MASAQFTPSAEEDLARLDRQVAQRVLKRIRWLTENLEDVAQEPLTGDWQEFFKLRVGDYRAIYTVADESTLIFHVIRHRREVYKSR